MAAPDRLLGLKATFPIRSALPVPATHSLPGRVRERPRRFGAEVLPIALLSLLVLVLDVGFIARLLDGVSNAGPDGVGVLGTAAAGTVDRLVLFGIGSAATLLVGLVVLWPLGGRRRRTLFCLAVIAVLLPPIVARTAGARLLGDAYADWRRSAVRIASLLPAIRDGSARVPGLDLAREGGARTGDDALLLLLPAATVVDGALGGGTDDTLRGLLLAVVERQSGGAAAAYDDRFVPSVRALRDAFNRYAERQRVLASALGAAPEQARSAWRTESADGELPAGADRDTFVAGATANAREAAENGFADDVAASFGARLPPGLSWSDFIANAAVQARWRASVGAPDDARLAPDMGFAAFERTVYRPAMLTLVGTRFGAALRPLPAFVGNEPEARAGLDALRAALFPVVAVAVAVAALAAALAVLSLCLFEMGPRPRSRGPAVVLVTAILLAPFARPNDASRSRGFAELDVALFASEGAVTALSARWWIEAAPMLHAFGTMVDDL